MARHATAGLARSVGSRFAPHGDPQQAQRWRMAAPHYALAPGTARVTGSRLVTLLTDFGLDDPYVGVLKAVLLRHCPAGRIIDLSHTLVPYDRLSAAFWIDRACNWFPAGTVHVVVVDPGVGSERRAVAIAARDQVFVGPDNGVLTGVFARDARAEARQIIPSALGLPSPSRTFHGRDVFAPVAARLAEGSLAFEEVGDRVASLCETVLPAVVEQADSWTGQVVTIDRFGNALTNLPQPQTTVLLEARVVGRKLPVVGAYADRAVGEIFAVFGSFGTLELAMREGHAASALGVVQGTPVELCRAVSSGGFSPAARP
jgi:S-adenosyl-L-methionine hydrolase (adenosine-forming)